MFFSAKRGRRRGFAAANDSKTDPSASPPTDDLSSYIKGWRSRDARDQEALTERHRHAREEALKLAQVLVSEFGVEEVYLIGSMATGQIRERSDIDLAVVGLNPVDYWKASARLNRETDLAVDLIDLSAALSSMVQRVQREGVLLLVRKDQ
jgi:predicted nucleotidyltransferase